MADPPPGQQAGKHYPKDGLVIVSMMKDLGITNYEPRVVNQLLEFSIRYVTTVLDDARAFATHSNRKSIENDDVKLAVMMQLDRMFITPPPRDEDDTALHVVGMCNALASKRLLHFGEPYIPCPKDEKGISPRTLLLEVARNKNNVPLPMVKPHCGIRLPPDRYCFSSCNYRLKSNLPTKKPESKFQSKYSGLGGSGGGGGMGSSSIKVSKPLSTGSSGGGSTNSTVVSMKRPQPAPTQVRVSQAAATKPVIKISPSWSLMNSSGGQSTQQQQQQQQQPQMKARVLPSSGTGLVPQQVEVKIEPHDSLHSAKRKREDGD